MIKHCFVTVLLLIQIGLLQAEQPDSVFSMKQQPLPKIAIPLMTAATAGAFFLDEPVRNHSSSSAGRQYSLVSDIGGEKTIIVPAVVASYGIGRFILKDPKLQATAWQSFQSIMSTAFITEALKISLGRARPFTEEGHLSFHPFSWSHDPYKSLPSGHTSLAFAAFTPFAENYSRWLYLVPASVAVGRVWRDSHWVSDVVLGSCIGFLNGFLFSNNENIQLLPMGVVVKF